MEKKMEDFYEIAALELAAKRPVAGLMAKAYSECEGDERRSYARYIKLRVAQLSDENRIRKQRERDQEQAKFQTAQKRAGGAEIVNSLCPRCGNDKAYRTPRGRWEVFVILLVIFVLPGLIYAFLTSGYNFECTECGNINSTHT